LLAWPFGLYGSRSELAERTALYLRNALGAHPQPPGYLAQAFLPSIQPVACPQNLAFTVAEPAQQAAQLRVDDASNDLLVLVLGERIGDKLTEGADLSLLA